LFVADQATKALALWFIPLHTHIMVIPGFFNLVLVHNTGAAFGMGSNNNTFFLGLAALALAIILSLWFRGRFVLRGTRIAVALLLAGILGNLLDRLLHGHVIDFLDFILPFYGHWPAFNIADVCICTAAGLLVLLSLLPEPRTGNGRVTS
jgi:signal peptidase II